MDTPGSHPTFHLLKESHMDLLPKIMGTLHPVLLRIMACRLRAPLLKIMGLHSKGINPLLKDMVNNPLHKVTDNNHHLKALGNSLKATGTNLLLKAKTMGNSLLLKAMGNNFLLKATGNNLYLKAMDSHPKTMVNNSRFLLQSNRKLIPFSNPSNHRKIFRRMIKNPDSIPSFPSFDQALTPMTSPRSSKDSEFQMKTPNPSPR